MKVSSPPTTKATMATRGSKLALWQANAVSDLLAQQGVSCTLSIQKTTGDKVQDRFLHEIGGKGLFIKELEEALIEDQADLAVHSMKDLPARVGAPFAVACVLKRHSPRDLLILHPKHQSSFGLVAGTVIDLTKSAHLRGFHIATGSLRRQLLLTHLNQNICVHPIRGNVDTRLEKLFQSEEWDALILAEASLERLGLLNHALCFPLDPEWFVPSPAQGALAIETLAESPWTPWLGGLACQVTTECVNVERAVLEGLGASCTLPIGVHVYPQGGSFVCLATVLSPSRSVSIRRVFQNEELSRLKATTADVLSALLDAGVNRVLTDLGLPLVLR